jgi:hypothetical protein
LVTAVAGISGQITAVAGVSGQVATVAGVSSEVATVAGVSGLVTTVAGISDQVTAVARVSGQVATVAGNSGPITTVANTTNLNAITTVATNIDTILSVAGGVTATISYAHKQYVRRVQPIGFNLILYHTSGTAAADYQLQSPSTGKFLITVNIALLLIISGAKNSNAYIEIYLNRNGADSLLHSANVRGPLYEESRVSVATSFNTVKELLVGDSLYLKCRLYFQENPSTQSDLYIGDISLLRLE